MQTIKLPEDVVSELERLQYEEDARRSLLEYLLSKNYDLNASPFKDYHDQYIATHVAYEKIKHNITQTYVVPNINEKDLASTVWNVDFETCELTF